MSLREDMYAGGPQNQLLRDWLSLPITREIAETSLQGAIPGSFIVRRSISSPGNYAVTVVLSNHKIRSYEVVDLGLGQVGLPSGQAFASLEHMIEFYYDQPFPDPGNSHVPLTSMHPHIVGFDQESAPDGVYGTATELGPPTGFGKPAIPPPSMSNRQVSEMYLDGDDLVDSGMYGTIE